jgi:2-C-methyl-D-erythritol 4-phosphate cytidylyltransferase
MNSAIILAGGSSERFGGNIPKQFLTVDGKQLIDIPISTFSKVKEIDEIIIVVPKNYFQEFHSKYSQHHIVIGGNSRKESSYNGLLACNKNTNKVLIHDAARIFVTPQQIKNCLNSLNKYDAVTLAIPVIDTIAFCEDDNIQKMENRNNLRAIQTPQGFDYKKIKLAHESFNEDATDDIRLMLELGYQCKTLDGHEENFKITTKNDFLRAEIKIKEGK